MATHVAEEGSIHLPSKARKSSKRLEEISIKKAENGGHVVTHRFHGFAHEPQHFAFGHGEGGKLMDHVRENMDVSDSEPEGGEEDDEEE